MSLETPAVDPETLAAMQQGFLEVLARIQAIARFRLRHLCGERKDEAVVETVALAWNAYQHLFLNGRECAPLIGVITEEVFAPFEENHPTPTAEQAAFRLDYSEWLDGLDDRRWQVAQTLASGLNAVEVARRHGVSRRRISQLRGDLTESWDGLHQEHPASAQDDGR